VNRSLKGHRLRKLESDVAMNSINKKRGVMVEAPANLTYDEFKRKHNVDKYLNRRQIADMDNYAKEVVNKDEWTVADESMKCFMSFVNKRLFFYLLWSVCNLQRYRTGSPAAIRKQIRRDLQADLKRTLEAIEFIKMKARVKMPREVRGSNGWSTFYRKLDSIGSTWKKLTPRIIYAKQLWTYSKPKDWLLAYLLRTIAARKKKMPKKDLRSVAEFFLFWKFEKFIKSEKDLEDAAKVPAVADRLRLRYKNFPAVIKVKPHYTAKGRFWSFPLSLRKVKAPSRGK
jgi:hypothetical protein